MSQNSSCDLRNTPNEADSCKIASESSRLLSYPWSTFLQWMFLQEGRLIIGFEGNSIYTNMFFVVLEIYVPECIKVSVQILLHIEGFWKLEDEG